MQESQVKVGTEANKLLHYKDLEPEESSNVIRESSAILNHCIRLKTSNDETISETGIVIGFIQSGKTLSITTVTALARDNDIPIVIVITGTSRLLLHQSHARLREDLQIDRRSDRSWRLIQNPSLDSGDGAHVNTILKQWEDETLPKRYKQSILITVMKNWRHLQNLTGFLGTIDLTKTPAIIIDDEADQASLNTKIRQNQQSTTYRAILDLRDSVPKHYYLQYTATPQAPLLITLIDILSPSFVELLTPGLSYTGTADFFESDYHYVQPIPEQDTILDEDAPGEPPTSLLHATRLFFIGVAAGYELDEAYGNRSMLIHPSHRTFPHRIFRNWLSNIKNEWAAIFDEPDEDPDKKELIGLFREAYREIAQTADSVPNFETIVGHLPLAIKYSEVKEINASRRGVTPTIDWKATYSYILVGGQSMDRGFTVEGLTITYMPRTPGIGNADSIQQRARFLGYKAKYLGYCRAFLEPNVLDRFRSIIRHEEDMRRQLMEVSKRGTGGLTEWRRVFYLDATLRPTRHNVLHMDYMRTNLGNTWIAPKPPYKLSDACNHNRKLLSIFLNSVELNEHPGHPSRSEYQSHLFSDEIQVSELLKVLLSRFQFEDIGALSQFMPMVIALKDIVDAKPDALCSIYLMSKGVSRLRRIEDFQLFQGANPSSGSGVGSIYPGDRRIFNPNQFSMQIHYLDISEAGVVVAEAVPTLALRMEDGFRGAYVVHNP